MIERVESLSRMVLGAISESSGLSGSRTYASLSKRFGGFSNAPRPRTAATASLRSIFLAVHLPCGPSSFPSIFLSAHLPCGPSSLRSILLAFYRRRSLFPAAIFLALFFAALFPRALLPELVLPTLSSLGLFFLRALSDQLKRTRF